LNTKVQSQHYKSLHPERGMMVNVNGELWVPVEITLIGNTDFLEALRRGIEEWTRYESDPDKRGLYMTRKVQELYRPVGLKETDLGLQYGSRDRIVQSFGQYTDAEEAFKKALLIDPEYVHGQVNLGSLMYLKGEYNAALIQFRDALSKLEKGGKAKSQDTVKVLLNLSKTYNALKLYDESNKYYELAYAISPRQTEMYDTSVKPNRLKLVHRRVLSPKRIFSLWIIQKEILDERPKDIEDKKLILLILYIPLLLFINYCSSISSEHLQRVKDSTIPTISILYPQDGSPCAKTVVVEGIVQGSFYELTINGNYAFVVGDYFTVIDITDPLSPSVAGFCSLN
jgi:hypothetical protein